MDLGSVSLGDPTYDAELGKPLWFDTKRNGKATFVSSAIKPTGAGKYDVAGKLSIKGATRDVVVPITLAGGVLCRQRAHQAAGLQDRGRRMGRHLGRGQ